LSHGGLYDSYRLTSPGYLNEFRFCCHCWNTGLHAANNVVQVDNVSQTFLLVYGSTIWRMCHH